jgi:hypothetical protein
MSAIFCVYVAVGLYSSELGRDRVKHAIINVRVNHHSLGSHERDRLVRADEYIKCQIEVKSDLVSRFTDRKYKHLIALIRV